jgi:hypothetical protein
MAHVVLKLEFKTVANATVAWHRGAWYLRGCDVVAALNRLISNNYQTL